MAQGAEKLEEGKSERVTSLILGTMRTLLLPSPVDLRLRLPQPLNEDSHQASRCRELPGLQPDSGASGSDNSSDSEHSSF